MAVEGQGAPALGRGFVGQHGHEDLGRGLHIVGGRAGLAGRRRSEEHTSELQSRLHLVCRLLLEKKKNAWISSSSSRGNRSRVGPPRSRLSCACCTPAHATAGG